MKNKLNQAKAFVVKYKVAIAVGVTIPVTLYAMSKLDLAGEPLSAEELNILEKFIEANPE